MTRLLADRGRFVLYRAAAAGDLGPGCYVVKSVSQAMPHAGVCSALLHREAAVAGTIQHANLSAVLAANLTEPAPFLVLPYLEGVTLRRLLPATSSLGPSSHSTLPIHSALCIVRQIAAALQALHSSRWLHGQVRPDHILISPQGQAKLIDLTQARRLESSECDTDGTFTAAAQYSAPETTSLRDRLTTAADTYSLGVILFEALTGQEPFSAPAPQQLMKCHRCQVPPDLRQLRAGVSLEVAHLVRRMLAKEPLRRPTDQELIRWLAELEIEELAS